MDLSAEEQLHKAMMDTYHLNLLFLSEFDNELFLRICSLTDTIGIGEYKERYFLEFIKESGDFDIYDSNEDKYIYNKKPKKFNNKAVVQTNFDLTNSINTLSAGQYNFDNEGDFVVYDNESVFSVAMKKFMNDFYSIKKELNIKIDREHKKINEIDKFIFVGTLLGRHIPKILKKTNAKRFFICENNLEIFRLSLFVCDYSALAVEGRKVVFSIMDDEKVFSSKFSTFFNQDIYNNSLLKFYSTNYNVEKYFDRIVDKALDVNPLSFNYYMHLDNVVFNLSQNFYKYKTLKLKIHLQLDTFEKKSVLYLGAGPSLGDNIQWVKENQDRFIIVTMAAALKILYENDIQPDIITTVDPQKHVEKQFFPKDGIESLIKKAIVIASINTNPEVIERLSNLTNIYLYEVLGSIQIGQKKFTGNSVGEITYSIISTFNNIKDIYLLGLDMALNQETGSTHSDDYEHSKKVDLKNTNNQIFSENYSARENFIKVKGNLKDEVLTSRLFYASLKYYNRESFSDQVQIYNLSNHGAFIENTKPTLISSLDKKSLKNLDKCNIRDFLIKDFDNLTVKRLDDKSLENLEKHLSLVPKLIKYLNNSKSFDTYEQLNQLSNDIFVLIMNDESKIEFLKEVYAGYSLAFNPYISYCMLIKKKNEKIKMNKIIIIWIEKLIELFEKYEEYLAYIVKKSKTITM